MNEYLVFTNEQDAIIAEQKISEKMGFPSGNTTCWAEVRKSYNDNLWFFISPEKHFLENLDINYQTITNITSFIPKIEF